MKNFILGFVITSLVAICVFFYIKNTSLTASINTYKNIAEVVSKDFQKAKEDYYIQQQSDNTSLILFTVTALFGLFSFFTFSSVKRMFDVNISEMENKYNEQITKYEESIIHINNLKSNISFQYADRLNDDFGKVLKEKPLNIQNLIFLGLMCCQNYCHTLEYSTSNFEEIKPRVFKYITIILDVMVSKVKVVETVEVESLTYEMFIDIKNTLDLNLDKDNLKKFSTIFSKLSFPPLD